MKSKPAWIRALRARRSLPPPRGAKAFWEDFRARARYVRQEAGAGDVPLPVPRPVPALRWAAGAAALAMAALLVAPALLRPAEAGPVLRSFEVAQPHDSVFILKDEPTKGTILWISGLPEPGAETAPPEGERNGDA